jgi:AAA family ATP:ADP antiporter
MSSPQASELAASVPGEETTWNSMNMANNAAVSAAASHDVAASQGLTGGRRRKSAKGGAEDDIYADIDQVDNRHDKEDTFLDRPVWESRGSAWTRRWADLGRFGEALYQRLYGDELPLSEMLRTLCLASTLFFMIGGYWTLRSLKDPVLTALCGVAVIPKAKMLSVVVVLVVVSVYNKLLDTDIPRHRLFYLFGTFYFCLFCGITLLLMHPTVGLANEQASPTRWLGWISYCSIESFGSVMVSLFWSFCNSNFSLKEAKASYGVMTATAQVGSILGPVLVNRLVDTWGTAWCYLIGASCMLWLQGTIYMYVSIYGTAERNFKVTKTVTNAVVPKKKKAGVLEGLQLFIKYNYVKGIFAISCLFMVEVTIVDYTMKVLARNYFANENPCTIGMSCFDSVDGDHGLAAAATTAFAKFMGFFGIAVNTLSFLMSLLGTSAVIRYLGLRLTLLLFPSLCLAVICTVRLHPTLYVVFGAMIALKAASYSLNNPTKEMLYQPTSAAVRYKAKSWIDIFGARGSKALGSVVTNAFADNTVKLIANGSLVGMCVASFLIWNARFMGELFEKYTSSGYVVGEDDDADPAASEAKNVEMASNQNEVEDTSCAIPDDEDDGEDQDEEEPDSDNDSHFAKKPEVTMV